MNASPKVQQALEDARLRGWQQAFEAACGAIASKATKEERERCALVVEYVGRTFERTMPAEARGCIRAAKWIRSGTEWITAPDREEVE